MLAERYRNRVIVVTGALGMIGSHITLALVEAGCSVLACDNADTSTRPPYLAGLELEGLISPEELDTWLQCASERVGAIVHMGAISDTTATNISLLTANNVDFTLSLWDRSIRCRWPFVYASSAATYGAGEYGFIDEDTDEYLGKLSPLNPYGASKQICDLQIASHWHAGLTTPPTWTGLKFFNVYGPNEDHKGEMRSLVAKLIPAIEAGKPVRLFRSHRRGFADGGQLRDFIYVKDAIRPVLLALGQDGLAGLHNVGTGVSRSFLDLANATCAAMGSQCVVEFIEMPDAIREQYQYFTRADIAKSVRAGLYDVRFSLEDGVADYLHTIRPDLRGSRQ